MQRRGARLRKQAFSCKPAAQLGSACAGFCLPRLRIAGCGSRLASPTRKPRWPCRQLPARARRNVQAASRKLQPRCPRLRLVACGCTLRLALTEPCRCRCGVRLAAAPCTGLAQTIAGTRCGLRFAVARCTSLAQRRWTMVAPCGVRLQLALDSHKRLPALVALCGLRP